MGGGPAVRRGATASRRRSCTTTDGRRPSHDPRTLRLRRARARPHEKAQLGILVSLTTRPEGLTFGGVEATLPLTDGNLSRHLDALAEEELVSIEESFQGRRPQTRATADGIGPTPFPGLPRRIGAGVVRDALPASAAEPMPRSRPRARMRRSAAAIPSRPWRGGRWNSSAGG